MLGILKLGIIPKVALVCVVAAGVAYLGYALSRPAAPVQTESEAETVAISAEGEAPQAEGGPLTETHARINKMSPFWRILIFVVIAFLLPLATMPIVKNVLAERSNKYNFLMLAAYTALDIVLASILIGILLTDFWAYFLFVLAVTASAVYNYVILSRIQELEQE